LHKTLTGEKDFGDVSLALRTGLHVVRWLPDFVSYVGGGEMRLVEFAQGGVTCLPVTVWRR
jgi:hypothetical protein